MGLYAKVLDPAWCHLLFVSQFCSRNRCLSVWLPREGTTFVLSFTMNMPGEFLWSVTCFIVAWVLHICETWLFHLSIDTDQNRQMFLWNRCDICVGGGWELRLNHRVFGALCPSLLSSQSVFHSTRMSNRQQWKWYWGSLLTSEGVSHQTLYVIQPLLETEIWKLLQLLHPFSPVFELLKK